MNLLAVLGKESRLDSPTLWMDDAWQQTDYMELCSDSQFWGNAVLVAVPKALAPQADRALLYLLQRIYQETESGNKHTMPSTPHELLTWASSAGVFESMEGITVPPATAWKSVKETALALLQTENAYIQKNGERVPALPLLEEPTILSATVFADDWNRCQYFIETESAWIYFDWLTMV